MNVNYSDKTELFKALSEFTAKCSAVVKSSPAHYGKYANLKTVLSTTEGPLRECGLLLNQLPTDDKCLATSLIHIESGQYIESKMPIEYKANDATSYGSGLSYARRYSILTILGLYTQDDDGTKAVYGGLRELPALPEKKLQAMIKCLNDGDIDKYDKALPTMKANFLISVNQQETLDKAYSLTVDKQNTEDK